MNNQCKICGNSFGNETFVVREMMYGTRENFTYFRCSSCGCLQITEPPKDISKFYPSDYYSFVQHEDKYTYRKCIKNVIKYCLVNIYIFLPIVRFFLKKAPYIRGLENSGKHKTSLMLLKKMKKTSSVLDVGSGIGILLKEISIWGFKNLTGIDPFIEKDYSYSSGVKIFKRDVFNHTGTYDLIMLHHSFEHMDNEHIVLRQLHELLNPRGILLIRIPVSDSFAFRKYGSNWFQIDAPRHFFLHTTRSMSILSKNSGFTLKQIIYDSTKDQFLESQNYCRDISFLEYNKKLPTDYYSKRYIKDCEKHARMLNRMMDGDQACFIFQKM